MNKYKELLNIFEGLREVEKEIDTYDPLDPTPSEKTVLWIKRISKWAEKNCSDNRLLKEIQWFWGWPSHEKIKKIAKAVLMICYEKKIKKLKKEEMFSIIEKELKE